MLQRVGPSATWWLMRKVLLIKYKKDFGLKPYTLKKQIKGVWDMGPQNVDLGHLFLKAKERYRRN